MENKPLKVRYDINIKKIIVCLESHNLYLKHANKKWPDKHKITSGIKPVIINKGISEMRMENTLLKNCNCILEFKDGYKIVFLF